MTDGAAKEPLPDLVFADGSVRFSHDRIDWHAGTAGVLHSRQVTETSADGSVHVRLAMNIEDELLDEVVRLRSEVAALVRSMQSDWRFKAIYNGRGTRPTGLAADAAIEILNDLAHAEVDRG